MQRKWENRAWNCSVNPVYTFQPVLVVEICWNPGRFGPRSESAEAGRNVYSVWSAGSCGFVTEQGKPLGSKDLMQLGHCQHFLDKPSFFVVEFRCARRNATQNALGEREKHGKTPTMTVTQSACQWCSRLWNKQLAECRKKNQKDLWLWRLWAMGRKWTPRPSVFCVLLLQCFGNISDLFSAQTMGWKWHQSPRWLS